MRTTDQLHERATLAVTPLAVLLAQAQTPTTTTPAPKSPIPDVKPNLADAPGGTGLQDAINVFATYALFAAVAGFLIGGGLWAAGSRVGNEHASHGGKTGMGVALAVAFLVGAAKVLVGFAYDSGSA